MARYIQAKTILSTVKHKPDPYFGLSYNMNLYRGCQHGCIYCDSRSKCYQLGELSDIRVKENAINMLECELRSKRTIGTIGFGSMNDCYMPVEKEYQLTRKTLEVIKRYHYPIHIITKSNLIVRDIDLLKEISKVYAAVSFTITTADDKLCKAIEPCAPTTSERFEAMSKLSSEGIYCGVTLMPVLPFINDSIENVTSIVEKAKAAGAKYILAVFGLTLREGNREYFYEALDKHFPGIRARYEKAFGMQYSCSSPNSTELYKTFNRLCNEAGIATKMDFYIKMKYLEYKLF